MSYRGICFLFYCCSKDFSLSINTLILYYFLSTLSSEHIQKLLAFVVLLSLLLPTLCGGNTSSIFHLLCLLPKSSYPTLFCERIPFDDSMCQQQNNNHQCRYSILPHIFLSCSSIMQPLPPLLFFSASNANEPVVH